MPETAFRGIRGMSAEDTAFLVRYSLVITIEIAVAVLLLTVAKGSFAWAVWIAYLILGFAAVAALIGVSWCWLCFVGAGFGWLLTTLVTLAVAAILIAGPDIHWHGILEWAGFAH